jgi:hypothetical protein
VRNSHEQQSRRLAAGLLSGENERTPPLCERQYPARSHLPKGVRTEGHLSRKQSRPVIVKGEAHRAASLNSFLGEHCLKLDQVGTIAPDCLAALRPALMTVGLVPQFVVVDGGQRWRLGQRCSSFDRRRFNVSPFAKALGDCLD